MRVRLISDDGIVVEVRHESEGYQPSIMRELCDHARRLLTQALADQTGSKKLDGSD